MPPIHRRCASSQIPLPAMAHLAVVHASDEQPDASANVAALWAAAASAFVLIAAALVFYVLYRRVWAGRGCTAVHEFILCEQKQPAASDSNQAATAASAADAFKNKNNSAWMQLNADAAAAADASFVSIGGDSISSNASFQPPTPPAAVLTLARSAAFRTDSELGTGISALQPSLVPTSSVVRCVRSSADAVQPPTRTASLALRSKNALVQNRSLLLRTASPTHLSSAPEPTRPHAHLSILAPPRTHANASICASTPHLHASTLIRTADPNKQKQIYSGSIQNANVDQSPKLPQIVTSATNQNSLSRVLTAFPSRGESHDPRTGTSVAASSTDAQRVHVIVPSTETHRSLTPTILNSPTATSSTASIMFSRIMTLPFVQSQSFAATHDNSLSHQQPKRPTRPHTTVFRSQLSPPTTHFNNPNNTSGVLDMSIMSVESSFASRSSIDMNTSQSQHRRRRMPQRSVPVEIYKFWGLFDNSFRDTVDEDDIKTSAPTRFLLKALQTTDEIADANQNNPNPFADSAASQQSEPQSTSASTQKRQSSLQDQDDSFLAPLLRGRSKSKSLNARRRNMSLSALPSRPNAQATEPESAQATQSSVLKQIQQETASKNTNKKAFVPLLDISALGPPSTPANDTDALLPKQSAKVDSYFSLSSHHQPASASPANMSFLDIPARNAHHPDNSASIDVSPVQASSFLASPSPVDQYHQLPLLSPPTHSTQPSTIPPQSDGHANQRIHHVRNGSDTSISIAIMHEAIRLLHRKS